MALSKGQVSLYFALALFQQRSHIPQSPGPTGQGTGASVVNGFERVILGQADEAHDRAQAQRTFALEHALRPLSARGAQFLRALEPVIQLPFQRTVSTTQAQHFIELSRLQMSGQLDLLPPLVEDTNIATVPTHP